jgi:hypothetical protein
MVKNGIKKVINREKMGGKGFENGIETVSNGWCDLV